MRVRIARFLDPSSGDTYQTDRAIESFTEGGFFGRGPGEGTIKGILPDAHTDFPFAVIGEEYGTVACLALVALFAFVVFRALWQVWAEQDAFRRLAVTGLALLFALQAAINMGVNVGLAPAKGMTLPFISSGGSSNLAAALLAGLLLSLTRRWPHAGRVKAVFPHHNLVGDDRATTARNINGATVAFDGTANITVTATDPAYTAADVLTKL